MKLAKKTVNFLLSIPGGSGYSQQERQALVYSSGLDAELISQIDFSGSAKIFFQFLVNKLLDYGQLSDGRNALIAVLEAAREFVGTDKQEQIDNLITDWQKYWQEHLYAQKQRDCPRGKANFAVIKWKMLTLACTGAQKAGGKIRWYNFRFGLRPPFAPGEAGR